MGDTFALEQTLDRDQAYYPGARRITIKVTGDRHTGRLRSAQLVGHRDARVAKRSMYTRSRCTTR